MDGMDRKALLHQLESTGKIHRHSKCPEWEAVFDAFKKDTGVGLSFTCGKCYSKAIKWLKT
jgi:hypothetical protein